MKLIVEVFDEHNSDAFLYYLVLKILQASF